MLRLKDKTNTPPGGFTWIDPITQLKINARNHDNWLTMATDHRVANALPLPDVAEMEDQLCNRYDEKTRKIVCQECDQSGPVTRLGVGGVLKSMLAAVGINACWGCTRLAEAMDAWGPAGCEERMPQIVEAMNENASKHKWMKYLPFKEMGAEALVRIAITKARDGSLLSTKQP